MKYTQDRNLLISSGEVSGYQHVFKFGESDIVSNVKRVIWEGADTYGDYIFQTTANTLEAISSSADDAAAGTGAQVLRVQGLNLAMEEIEEDITLNGTSASSATSQSFFRVNRAFVLECGTYATNSEGKGNLGNITIRVSGGGDPLGYISANQGYGQTQQVVYTVPKDYTAFLYGVEFSIDNTKTVDTYLWKRENADQLTPPYTARRLIHEFNHSGGSPVFQLKYPIKIGQKTDIFMSAQMVAGTAKAAASLEILLIKSSLLK